MPLILDKSIDLECPHCPVKDTGAYIEFHYRRKRGTWDEIEEYADRITRYVVAALTCTEETRTILAKLALIPAHRSDISGYDCNALRMCHQV